MKMKNIFIGFVVLLAICFLGCKKDIANPGDNTIVDTFIDSPYLTKIVWDNNLERNYKYDSQKRVIFYSDSLISEVIAHGSFFYNGNDSFPSKSVINYNQPYRNHISNWHYTDTTFYKYDINKRRIYDSVISFFYENYPGARQLTIEKYKYFDNKIIGEGNVKAIPNTSGSSSRRFLDTAVLDNNNNIVSSKRLIYFNGIGSSADTIRSNFTYDDKISPFSLLSTNKAAKIFSYEETFFTEFMQTNNTKTSFKYFRNPYTFNRTFEDFTSRYIYLPNGLPKEIYIPNDRRVQFFYIKL